MVIGVLKELEVVSDPGDPVVVQTTKYSYTVSVRGRHPIFRYDNHHEDWLHQGHLDKHHRHVYDWKTGDRLPDSPIWVGADRWPTLSDVIDEAGQWYDEHWRELGSPNEFVPLSELRSGVQQ